MNQQEIIQAEAERLYPVIKSHNLWEDEIYLRKEKQNAFKHGATFVLSLNGWVKVTPEAMPTEKVLSINHNGDYLIGILYEVAVANDVMCVNDSTYMLGVTHWKSITPPNN